MPEQTPVLEAVNLTRRYRVTAENSLRARTVPVVQEVSLRVMPGETFGIVGESGCGKSTVARLLLCLEKPTAGEIWWQGRRVDGLPERTRSPLRPAVQMVFQDSGSSLNPRKRVADILREPMLYHHIVPKDQVDARVDELLEMVGLPAAMGFRYPHEFSGGQRQRICIARALSLQPEVVVLDEPVSALDVSVQAQILNLLRSLQEQLGMAYVFIGHGLAAVRYVSHRIAVMYLGRVVELGPSDAMFDRPAHPYTRALLDAAPVADDTLRSRPRAVLTDEVDKAAPAGACPLYGRCPRATADCLRFDPALKPVPGTTDRWAACLRGLEG